MKGDRKGDSKSSCVNVGKKLGNVLPKCFLIRLWLEAIVEQLGDLLLDCTTH